MWQGIRFEVLPVQTRGVLLHEDSHCLVQAVAFAYDIRASPGENARPWHRHHSLMEDSTTNSCLSPETTVQDERRKGTSSLTTRFIAKEHRLLSTYSGLFKAELQSSKYIYVWANTKLADKT
jgi:hypothetical protein